MLKNLQVVAVLMCMLSYTGAETASIGTASARGDLRVNNYAVKGNATLFNGSVVETGQATADLRLNKGTEITMSTSSQGTLYRDHLVLQRGESQVASNSSFQLEAKGLHVTATEPNSRGVVSVQTGNTVEVAALTGSFGVTNAQGVVLASVRPGHSMSFAMQTAAPPATLAPGVTPMSGTGMVSFENGHYYITADNGVKYEVVGKDLKSFVNTKVQFAGNVQTAGSSSTITLSSVSLNGGAAGGAVASGGFLGGHALLIGGALVIAGTASALGVVAANSGSTAASR
jgi:hypothetical protein